MANRDTEAGYFNQQEMTYLLQEMHSQAKPAHVHRVSDGKSEHWTISYEVHYSPMSIADSKNLLQRAFDNEDNLTVGRQILWNGDRCTFTIGTPIMEGMIRNVRAVPEGTEIHFDGEDKTHLFNGFEHINGKIIALINLNSPNAKEYFDDWGKDEGDPRRTITRKSHTDEEFVVSISHSSLTTDMQRGITDLRIEMRVHSKNGK